MATSVAMPELLVRTRPEIERQLYTEEEVSATSRGSHLGQVYVRALGQRRARVKRDRAGKKIPAQNSFSRCVRADAQRDQPVEAPSRRAFAEKENWNYKILGNNHSHDDKGSKCGSDNQKRGSRYEQEPPSLAGDRRQLCTMCVQWTFKKQHRFLFRTVN